MNRLDQTNWYMEFKSVGQEHFFAKIPKNWNIKFSFSEALYISKVPWPMWAFALAQNFCILPLYYMPEQTYLMPILIAEIFARWDTLMPILSKESNWVNPIKPIVSWLLRGCRQCPKHHDHQTVSMPAKQPLLDSVYLTGLRGERKVSSTRDQ